MKYEIREYEDGGGSPFHKWMKSLDGSIKARVYRQLVRMENGNFGDSKAVGDGVQELRMHFGAGYRVYYGRDGDTVIILLGGGSKRGQSADIQAAKERWAAYRKARG
jgi:putative addiction module killer protein